MAGVAYNQMYWRYENTIEVDGNEIGSDMLQGIELFAGMGFNLAQIRHFHLGV